MNESANEKSVKTSANTSPPGQETPSAQTPAWLKQACTRFARTQTTPDLHLEEIGRITTVGTGIAKVSGLPGVGFEEMLDFGHGVKGIAFNVDPDEVGVVLLGGNEQLHAGDAVKRSGKVMEVPVGDALLGRVINPLGMPLDGGAPLHGLKQLPIERPAPPIMDRAPVTTPLQTGIKAIDALVPIGRGQRELILGDRQTGKSTIGVDTIINQKHHNVRCIYCAIGQRAAAVARVIAAFKKHGAMEYTTVVVTEGSDPPGMAYIAPYAATTIAEEFMHQGEDVLIVYDDLTHHARAYRELSLLLRRPPGREAFPGDIFYLHSRLLERSTQLKPERGGGSLTALPIVETEAQNLAAYIPTNLISITDGQIYLSPRLFEKGQLPAIDVGTSVSRVGGKAQYPAYRAIVGSLKLAYAQFEELENFARFGTRLDKSTRASIAHGHRIRACLQQHEHQTVSTLEQIAILQALDNGLFDSIALEQMDSAQEQVQQAIRSTVENLTPAEIETVLQDGEHTSTPLKQIKEKVEQALQQFDNVADSEDGADGEDKKKRENQRADGVQA